MSEFEPSVELGEPNADNYGPEHGPFRPEFALQEPIPGAHNHYGVVFEAQSRAEATCGNAAAYNLLQEIDAMVFHQGGGENNNPGRHYWECLGLDTSPESRELVLGQLSKMKGEAEQQFAQW